MSQAVPLPADLEKLRDKVHPNDPRVVIVDCIEDFEMAARSQVYQAAILKREEINSGGYEDYMRARAYIVDREIGCDGVVSYKIPRGVASINALPLELDSLKSELVKMYNFYVSNIGYSSPELLISANWPIAATVHDHEAVVNCPFLGRGTAWPRQGVPDTMPMEEAPTGHWLYMGDGFRHVTPEAKLGDPPKLLCLFHWG